MPSKLDELVFQVEAVLFASGKPLSVKELTDALGLEDFRAGPEGRPHARTNVREPPVLARGSARVGDRFALQLKEEYVPTVHAVTPVEMGARTVKALTLIAYHQPILQSHLVRMLGDIAYRGGPASARHGSRPHGTQRLDARAHDDPAVRRVLRHPLLAPRGDPEVPRRQARGLADDRHPGGRPDGQPGAAVGVAPLGRSSSRTDAA